jgi:hypothetical protein
MSCSGFPQTPVPVRWNLVWMQVRVWVAVPPSPAYMDPMLGGPYEAEPRAYLGSASGVGV